MIDIYDFIQALNDASQEGDIINPSASGTTCQMILQTWKVKKNQRFITNFVLGEMGAGLPASIGAALATGKRIIHIEGDGGFQLNIQELETVRRLNLPIIMFIINNNGYHSIRLSQTKNFGRLTGADDTSGLTLPNIQQISVAYGIKHSWIIRGDDYASEMGAWKDILDAIMNYQDNVLQTCVVFTKPDQQFKDRHEMKFIDGKWEHVT